MNSVLTQYLLFMQSVRYMDGNELRVWLPKFTVKRKTKRDTLCNTIFIPVVKYLIIMYFLVSSFAHNQIYLQTY